MQCSMYREQLLSWLWKTVMPTLADNFWERACSCMNKHAHSGIIVLMNRRLYILVPVSSHLLLVFAKCELRHGLCSLWRTNLTVA